MLARIILIVLCLSLLVCCNQTASEKTVTKNICETNLEINEVEATSAAVASLSKSNFPEGKTLIILNKTIVAQLNQYFPEILKAYIEKVPEYETAVIEDFEVKNQISRGFDKVLKIPRKYEYISESDFLELKNPYLEKNDPLIKRFPNSIGKNAIIGFSRAGFNADFSKAVIYAFRWNEHGSFFFLEKENCQWQIKQEQMIWMH